MTRSDREDPYLDLELEIKGMRTLGECLEAHAVGGVRLRLVP